MNSERLFGPSAETLWKKKRKTRTSLTSSSNLPPKIAADLGNAEMLYVNGDVQQAIDLLSNVSRQAPKLFEPYNILGLIYEESGDYVKALQLYILAATFAPKSLDLWKKVARFAGLIGEYDQAISACIRCFKFEPIQEHVAQRIVLLVRSHQLKRARETLKGYFARFPEQLSFLIDYGDEVEKIGVSDVALNAYLKYVFHWLGTNCTRNELLLSFVREEYDRKSLGVISNHLDDIFYAVRKTVDILLHKTDGLLPAIDLIDVCVDCHQAISTQLPFDATGAPSFPLDLSLLMGICKLKQRDEQSVEIGLTILNPILKKLEESDLDSEGNPLVPGSLNLAGSIHGHASSSAGYDTSDSEQEDEADVGGSQSSSNKDLTAIVSAALSDFSLFLVRQRIRVAEEFAGLGMLTRADKLLSMLSNHLRNVEGLLIRVDDGASNAMHPSLRLSRDENLMKALASMWRDIGNVYLLLDKVEHAYAAYTTSLGLNDSDIEVMSRYAELTRLHFPSNAEQVYGQLTDHFQSLIQEYQSACSEVATSADAPPTSKKPSTRSSGQKTVRFQDSADVPMDVTEDSVSQAAAQASLTVSSSGSGAVSNDVHRPLDVTLGEDMDLLEEDDDDDGLGVAASGAGDTEGENVPADEEEEEEEEDGEGVRRAAGKGSAATGGKERFFTRSALQHELFALVEWCHLLLSTSSVGGAQSQDNLLSFCSITVPLLEHWCFSSSYAAGVLEGTHHKHRRKHKRQVVSMHDLVNTTSSMVHQDKNWLTSSQNSCGRLINGLCDFVNVEKLVSKDVLLDLAKKTAPILTEISSTLHAMGATTGQSSLAQLSSELLHACTLMHLRRSSKAKRFRPSAADVLIDEVQSESDPDTSDSEEEEEEGTGTGSERQMKLSTRKRKLSSVQSRVRRRRSLVRMTGVNGGLMFNDFKAAAAIPREDPFLAAAAPFSNAVKESARKLLDSPEDIAIANLLFRQVMAESSMFETAISSKYLDNIFPVSRLYTSTPQSVVSAVLSGNDHNKIRRHRDAIERYINAFCVAPDQPLVVLCLATFLITLSNHSHVKHRHEALMKGMYLLQRYSEVRKVLSLPSENSRSGELLTRVAMEQETHYNLGKALHDIQLFHLAVDQYNLALALTDKHPELLLKKSLHVTREAAYNLVLIYKRSESYDLALEVMSKYLSFD